ncbi:MAG: hypothetical protein ACYS67_12605 [Planctomycetota bacterium]|jgi:hypothetical protein
MIAFDPNSTCEQAKAHYYEYLFGDTKKCVSTHMFGHIDRCSSCQAEVRRLKVILAEGEGEAVGEDRQKAAVITTYLRFHFVYLRALVDCKTIKLFLPSLAIPALQVSVPTPITVHLDNCEQCTGDLEAIHTHICSEARNKIASVGAMVFEDASPEILRHLCVCPECRQLLYEDRDNRIEKLPLDSDRSPMPCDAISPADIFDYVIPFGIEPDHDSHVMFRKSLTSHLINCPRCLDRMQKLHDTVYNVFERHESGIVTRFNICESGRESTVDGSDGPYKDWPIEVQVFDNSEETRTVETGALEDVTASPEPETKRKLSSLRPFVKPAMAAAAVILIALLFNIPAARAVNLSQISKALKKVKNVYFATSDTTDDAVPAQEIWISQALNLKLFKTGAEYFLWDIKAGSKIKRDSNTGSITTTPLDTNVSLNVKEIIRSLLPLNNMYEVPKGAQWLQVDEKDIVNPIAGTQAYDLIWTDKHLLGAVRKWRGYIDIETKRPKRIEWWIKLGQEQEYCESVTEISYPTTDDIKDVIEKAGF